MSSRPRRRWTVAENSVLEEIFDAHRDLWFNDREGLVQMLAERLNECIPNDRSALTTEKIRYQLAHRVTKWKRETSSSRATPAGRVGKPQRQSSPSVIIPSVHPLDRHDRAVKHLKAPQSSSAGRKSKARSVLSLKSPLSQHQSPKLAMEDLEDARQREVTEMRPNHICQTTSSSRTHATETLRAGSSNPGNFVMEVEPWERSNIMTFRSLMSQSSYGAPPTHSHVRSVLSGILIKLDYGIQCFLQAHPCSYLNMDNASQDALDLCQVSFAGSPQDEVIDKMETMSSHSALTLEVLLHVLGCNALFSWVFNGFKENPQSHMPFAVENTLNYFAQHNPEAVRRLNIATKLKHLETTLRPRLPVHAEEFQIRLFNIFKSMRVAPANKSRTSDTIAGSPKMYGFRYHQDKHREWKKTTRDVFLDALNFRADLAGCSRQYEAHFFEQDEPFDEDRMEIHHLDGEGLSEKSKVYVCLQPAIVSYPRASESETSNSGDEVVVVKAKVMVGIAVSGFEPSAGSVREPSVYL